MNSAASFRIVAGALAVIVGLYVMNSATFGGAHFVGAIAIGIGAVLGIDGARRGRAAVEAAQRR